MSFRTPILLLSCLVLSSCGDSKEKSSAKLANEREEQQQKHKDRVEAECLARNPDAIDLNPTLEDQLMALNGADLTIERQDSISESPNQLYWLRNSNFDLHRVTGGIQLIVRDWSGIYFITCTESQAAGIVDSRKQRGHAEFLFVFRLSAVSPFHLALTAESDDDPASRDAYLAVDADAIQVRRFNGTLVDFADLSAGTPAK